MVSISRIRFFYVSLRGVWVGRRIAGANISGKKPSPRNDREANTWREVAIRYRESSAKGGIAKDQRGPGIAVQISGFPTGGGHPSYLLFVLWIVALVTKEPAL